MFDTPGTLFPPCRCLFYLAMNCSYTCFTAVTVLEIARGIPWDDTLGPLSLFSGHYCCDNQQQ